MARCSSEDMWEQLQNTLLGFIIYMTTIRVRMDVRLSKCGNAVKVEQDLPA